MVSCGHAREEWSCGSRLVSRVRRSAVLQARDILGSRVRALVSHAGTTSVQRHKHGRLETLHILARIDAGRVLVREERRDAKGGAGVAHDVLTTVGAHVGVGDHVALTMEAEASHLVGHRVDATIGTSLGGHVV